jgi:putrescine transport system permease protein
VIVLKISLTESSFSMPPFSVMFSKLSEYTVSIVLNFKNYVIMLHESYYMEAFLNSACLGIVTSTICLLFGFPIAYGVHSIHSTRKKNLLMMLVALSFWTAFMIRVYSIMSILGYHGIVNSFFLKIGLIHEPIQLLGGFFAICIGMIFCYLPLMIFPIYAALEKVETSHIEAAQDLGCTSINTFWHVVLPLAKSGVFSGCVIVFATASGEFVIPELLGSADTITFGRMLWTEFFTNLDWPMACALTIVMTVVIFFGISIFQRREKDYGL